MIIDKEAMTVQKRTDSVATYEKAGEKSCPTEILETLAGFNIEGRPIWKPMHLQPIFAENKFVSALESDNGSDIFARGLCLPSDNKMTRSQQDTVIDIIRHCFD